MVCALIKKSCSLHGRNISSLAKEEQPHWAVRREEIKITSEELGRGSYGEVKVAKLRGYHVAAKCFHQHLIISEYYRHQFKRENEHLCQDSPS